MKFAGAQNPVRDWKGAGRLLSAVLLAILGAATASAGINVWTSLGPEGGYVGALAINPQNPSTVYAGTSGGIFKSIDAGKSWSAVNSGLTTFDIANLSIDPQNPGTVYAVTYGSGVFKSTDAGVNWRPVNSGLPIYANGVY